MLSFRAFLVGLSLWGFCPLLLHRNRVTVRYSTWLCIGYLNTFSMVMNGEKITANPTLTIWSKKSKNIQSKGVGWLTDFYNSFTLDILLKNQKISQKLFSGRLNSIGLKSQKVKEHEMQEFTNNSTTLDLELMNLLRRENFYYSFMLNDKWIGDEMGTWMSWQFPRCHPNGVKMTIITLIRKLCDWKSWSCSCCQSSWSCRDTAKNLSEFPSFPGHY